MRSLCSRSLLGKAGEMDVMKQAEHGQFGMRAKSGLSRWRLGFATLTALALTVLSPAVTQAAPPGTGLQEIANVDKDGTENQHLAFDKNTAFVGNVDGFRTFDISNPRKPRLLVDFRCRAGREGDLTTFRSGKKLYLVQSVDRPQTAEDCTSVDTGTIVENGRPRARFGLEGIRVFDVTNPAKPAFLKMYRTSCGAHVHTLVPDPQRSSVHVYIASYPLLDNTTPAIDREEAGALGCTPPHEKFPIVTLPLSDPTKGTVREKALSSDTQPFDIDGPAGPEPAFIGCRHFQAFLPRDIMVVGCSGDAQYWSIADRSNPTASDGEAHTHIRTGDGTGTNYLSGASVTWDGKIAVINDSTASAASCQAAATVNNFTYYFPLVKPGDPAPSPLGRYTIPRAQGSELCAGRAGTVLPTNERYIMSQAYLQGGTSLVDFTDPANPREIAYADIEDTVGKDDTFTAYWYNGFIYANSGINRREADANRGLEIFKIQDPHINKLVKHQHWTHLNPQTQEKSQVPT